MFSWSRCPAILQNLHRPHNMSSCCAGLLPIWMPELSRAMGALCNPWAQRHCSVIYSAPSSEKVRRTWKRLNLLHPLTAMAETAAQILGVECDQHPVVAQLGHARGQHLQINSFANCCVRELQFWGLLAERYELLKHSRWPKTMHYMHERNLSVGGLPKGDMRYAYKCAWPLQLCAGSMHLYVGALVQPECPTSSQVSRTHALIKICDTFIANSRM